MFNPILCFSVVYLQFYLEVFLLQASEFDELKHESESAALILSALLHGGWKPNKFALKDTSCQLQRGCRPLAPVLEFTRDGFHQIRVSASACVTRGCG